MKKAGMHFPRVLFTSLTALFALGSAVTPAQTVVNGVPQPLGPARYVPSYEELKAALGLSDQQIAELQKVQEEKIAASSSYFRKLQEKRKDLNQSLEGAAPDPAKIGQLEIEIQQLQKQGPPQTGDARDKSVAILTAEQRAKLEKLEEALKQRPAIDQALQLNLLKPPAPRTVAVGPNRLPTLPPSAPKD